MVLHQFEIELAWIGKGEIPSKWESEYGVGTNPPIVLSATDKKEVRLYMKKTLKKLRLVGKFKIKKIIKVT